MSILIFKHLFANNTSDSHRHRFVTIELTLHENCYQIYGNNASVLLFTKISVQVKELVILDTTLKTKGTKIEYGRKLSTRGYCIFLIIEFNIREYFKTYKSQ